MSNNKSEIAIVGAGVAGVTAAYYLVKEGYTVTVYDREDYAGMQCSRANGGQISTSNSETWHSWSNVLKGIKWMFKKDAPLLIRPGLDVDRAKWLARFLYGTASNIRERNTAETIKMALEARILYQHIAYGEKIDFDFSKSGILHFYSNQQYFENAKKVQSLYESNGCEWTILSEQQVYDIEPTLANNRTIVGGVWTENDWVGDIHKFCHELMGVLRNKYGVVFRSGPAAEVNDIRDLLAMYGQVVIANGAESTKFSKQLKDTNTIYPVKGYSITLPGDQQYFPKVSLLDDQAKIVTSTLGDRLRVAGTAELCGYNYDITKDRIVPLLNWVRSNFPHIDTREYSSWACLRPMTSDMLPMVCKSKMPGVYYHTGHGHLGWTLAPATAQKLVKLIQNDS
jgi:D-amino-acid dehydrogenase